MLRPGGILRLRDLVFSFEPHGTERHAESWLEGAADDPAEGWTWEEYATHLREEHSTFSWLLETLPERVGLEPRQADYSDDRMFASYLPSGPLRTRLRGGAPRWGRGRIARR